MPGDGTAEPPRFQAPERLAHASLILERTGEFCTACSEKANGGVPAATAAVPAQGARGRPVRPADGRSPGTEATWADRLQADVEYVETWSLWLDIRILARTVLAVLGGRGVIPDANSIMRDLDVERSGKPRWNS